MCVMCVVYGTRDVYRHVVCVMCLMYVVCDVCGACGVV